MKNITLAVPDEVYRAARTRAAEQGTSVSAMVAAYLASLSGEEDNFGALEVRQQEIRSGIPHFRAGDRLRRDQVHERAIR